MVDTLTPEERSRHMARIRGKDTKPEMVVRSISHRLGYRHRLGGCGLPGRPDLVYPRLGAVVFVHGCFWHQHQSSRCGAARIPKSNTAYWAEKLAANRARDARAVRRLRRWGWRVLVVWECETRHPERVARRLARFLGRG